jgi:hypothetical protein
MTFQDLVHWIIIKAWMVESITDTYQYNFTYDETNHASRIFFSLSSCKTFKKKSLFYIFFKFIIIIDLFIFYIRFAHIELQEVFL